MNRQNLNSCQRLILKSGTSDLVEGSAAEPLNQTFNELFYSDASPLLSLPMGVNVTGSSFTTENYYS